MNGQFDTELGQWAIFVYVVGIAYHLYRIEPSILTVRAKQIIRAIRFWLFGATITSLWWISAHHGLYDNPSSDSFWHMYKGQMQVVVAIFWGFGAVDFIDAFKQWSWSLKITNFSAAFVLGWIATHVIF